MRPGEIYLANFPFGDAPGMKLRPVLVLTAPVGASAEVVVAYVSSVVPPAPLPTDMTLDPKVPAYFSTGLKVVSALRLHKLATLHSSSVRRYLGSLSPATMAEAQDRLRTFLQL